MKAISLFSGVGGFDLGFERAGIETVLQAEQDPHCLKVLARHWPQRERVTDVRCVGMGSSKHHEQREPGNLVYGGFPCQDLSVAGKRAGLGGGRSGLWFEFHRVLSELRPRWVVIENVPGLLSSNMGRDFAIVLMGLEELGYGWAYRVLDAQYFGVPQRRRRVFIVGCLGDQPRARAVLSVCESCGGNPEASRTARKGATGAIAIRVANTGANGHGIAEDVAYTLDGAQGQAVLAASGSAIPRLAKAIRTMSGGVDREDMHTLIAAASGGDASGSLPLAKSLGSNASGGFRFDLDHDTYIPEIAYTIAAREAKGVSMLESQTNYVAMPGVRRLTPLECERLQGFPDGWTDGQSDSHRYRQLGNAVCVPVAEWIGHRIVAVSR